MLRRKSIIRHIRLALEQARERDGIWPMRLRRAAEVSATMKVKQRNAIAFAPAHAFAPDAAEFHSFDLDARPQSPRETKRPRQPHDSSRLPRERVASRCGPAFCEDAEEEGEDRGRYR